MSVWKDRILELMEVAKDFGADDLDDVIEYMGRKADGAPFPELKECPFCGTHYGRLVAYNVDCEALYPKYSVECLVCGASTRRIEDNSTHKLDFDCEAAFEATRLWNRREDATPGKK